MGYSEAQMRAAMRRDQERAGLRLERVRIGRTGRMTHSVDLDAAMCAVNNEGPDVLSAAADGYWADQRRRYPWIDCDPDTRGSVGLRNRLGRVKERTVYGPHGERRVLAAGGAR
jgi:hypothetical protein